jgi:unsaturated rhamnogalacturonyl hydrolase
VSLSASPSPTARDLLARIARRTLAFDFSVWQWGDAITIDGMLDAADLLDEPIHRERMLGFYRRWAARPLGWMDHLTPGLGLVRLARVTGDPDLLAAAGRLADWLRAVPHTADGLALYRPDLGTVRHSCWVDTIYHEPVFLATLADEVGDPALHTEALGVWLSHTRALSSPAGPFLAHSTESALGLVRGYGWGRGNAWAYLGMVDALEVIPRGVPGRDTAAEEFLALSDALLEVQDRSGFWRTLLHDRTAYLETSTAAMFGAAFTKARRLGLLDDPRLEEAIERAWAATCSRVDDQGEVHGVSAWTHASITRDDHPDYYRQLPIEVNWWGQGAGLRAAAERLRAGLT